jgi:hypothetical protein
MISGVGRLHAVPSRKSKCASLLLRCASAYLLALASRMRTKIVRALAERERESVRVALTSIVRAVDRAVIEINSARALVFARSAARFALGAASTAVRGAAMSACAAGSAAGHR